MNKHHLAVLIQHQAEKYGNREALYYRDYQKSKWIPITWNEFSDKVKQTANAFVSKGIKEFDKIGILSQNKPECLYVDFGLMANRAITVPLYATSSPAQIRYILNDTQMEYLFVGEQTQYDAAFSIIGQCDCLKGLIIFDSSVIKNSNDTTSIYFTDFIRQNNDSNNIIVQKRTSEATEEDIANILYTSGTTGEPKGVMLLQSNYLETFRIHDIRLTEISDKDVSLNFLPLTHVFERAWVYYCLHKGIKTYINLRPSDVQMTIKEVRPTLMCSVPRFWEKVYIGVQEKIAKETGIQKNLILNALHIGKIYNINYIRLGKKPPMYISMLYHIYEKTIIKLLKKTIGIENGNFFPTAGSVVSDKVCEFVHSVGINMLVGYGLTESTATVSCEWKTNYEIGSVGIPMPGIEIKISDNEEILLRGKTISPGYYNKEKETSTTIDNEGWLHTGDSGYVYNNHLYLKERIKDLYKTSNGKYIAPQALESQLTIDQYIDQIIIIGDQRKFVSALIVPNYELVKEYAKTHHLNYNSLEDLLKDKDINEYYKQRIDTLQQQFAPFEQIKHFTLISSPFTMEKGELTNTLKIKRNVIIQNYIKVINKMYEC